MTEMKKSRSPFRLFKNETQRYVFWGAVFGFSFPVVATIIKVLFSQLPFNLSSAINVQGSDPVLWIVDTAPIFLGYLAGLAGRRQDDLQHLTTELSLREKSLQNAQATLEEKVKERTSELDSANRKAQARTDQIQAVTQLSQTIALVQNPDELLPLIARLISERFGFYHVGVFLLDEKKEYAVLRATNSEGGKHMLERGHRLKVGGTGIVGFAAQAGYPRLALDTGEDFVYFNNPDLPETHSEVSLPLKVGDQVIGVLDVQSIQPSAFNSDDVDVLSTLANQVAIVIQNASLFEQIRNTVQSFGMSGRQGWLGRGEEKASGYSYSPDGTLASLSEDSDQLLQSMLASGKTTVLEPVSEGLAPGLAIPVKLRDRVIGIIHIETTEADHKWSDNEISIVQSISERAALALENAVLFEETARRAERERVVSEITSRISESTNFDRILQTTIQELGRALGTSRAFIQLETTPTSDNTISQ